jgi:hypothetical protein
MYATVRICPRCDLPSTWTPAACAVDGACGSTASLSVPCGYNPLTRCEASSLWRRDGRPGKGILVSTKNLPRVGEGEQTGKPTRLGPFQVPAGEGGRICAGGCRLPAPVPRSSPRPSSLRVCVRQHSWPHFDPDNALAVDLLSRDARGNRRQGKVPALIARVGAQKG